MLRTLIQDEAGFIVSAELVLVATIVVIGMIVGLSEIQHSVVQELNDVAEAIGSINQSYAYQGLSASKTQGAGAGTAIKSIVVGSFFIDRTDECDGNECDIACDVPPLPEVPKT